MSRHVTDQSDPKAEGQRVKRFLDLQRKEGIHPTVRALAAKPRATTPAKVTQFLRIERELA